MIYSSINVGILRQSPKCHMMTSFTKGKEKRSGIYLFPISFLRFFPLHPSLFSSLFEWRHRALWAVSRLTLIFNVLSPFKIILNFSSRPCKVALRGSIPTGYYPRRILTKPNVKIKYIFLEIFIFSIDAIKANKSPFNSLLTLKNMKERKLDETNNAY